jgi:hypothetical protein
MFLVNIMSAETEHAVRIGAERDQTQAGGVDVEDKG